MQRSGGAVAADAAGGFAAGGRRRALSAPMAALMATFAAARVLVRLDIALMAATAHEASRSIREAIHRREVAESGRTALAPRSQPTAANSKCATPSLRSPARRLSRWQMWFASPCRPRSMAQVQEVPLPLCRTRLLLYGSGRSAASLEALAPLHTRCAHRIYYAIGCARRVWPRAMERAEEQL